MNKISLSKIDKININRIGFEINKNIIDEISGDITFKLDCINTILNSDYSKRTIEQLIILFKKVKMIEDIYAKDIYNFNLDETYVLLKSLKKSSLSSLASDKSLIEKYILLAHDNNKVNLALHPIIGIKRNNLSQFINTKTQSNKYITYSEYLSMLEKCINPQDQAILILIWNGFVNKDLDLIRSIKISDIRIDSNEVAVENYIYNSEESLFMCITLEEFEMKIIKNAIEQSSYINKGKDRFITELKSSPYLIRSNRADTKVGLGLVSGRFKNSCKLTKNNDLVIQSLCVSGIYNKVSKMNLSEPEYIKKMMRYKISRPIAKDVKKIVDTKLIKESSGC